MKLKILVSLTTILTVFVWQAGAQTNSIVFPELLSCSNTVLMTNAEFRCTSGTRVFFKNGSDYKFFDAFTLNSNVLAQIGISTNKLIADNEKIQKQKLLDTKNAALLAEYKYELSTNVQTFNLISTQDGFVYESSMGKAVVIRGLPDSVRSFFQQKQQLTDQKQQQTEDITALENYHPTITTKVYDPNDPDPQSTAEMLNQEAVDNAAQAKETKLETMRDSLNDLEDSLKELNSEAPERTSIKAFFTGELYGDAQIWQCVQ